MSEVTLYSRDMARESSVQKRHGKGVRSTRGTRQRECIMPKGRDGVGALTEAEGEEGHEMGVFLYYSQA